MTVSVHCSSDSPRVARIQSEHARFEVMIEIGQSTIFATRREARALAYRILAEVGDGDERENSATPAPEAEVAG